MQSWILQENDFGGKINLNAGARHSFYQYSLWRSESGEHLFDGAAGDLNEALDTMRAHIQFLSFGEGCPSTEQ